MELKEIVAPSVEAVRNNLRPGIVLWIMLMLFMLGYFYSDRFREILSNVAVFKENTGRIFSFGIYFMAAGIMPELLKVVLTQRFRVTGKNIANTLYLGTIFGIVGVIVDVFYQFQAQWFGDGNTFTTLTCKTLVDQFLFSPVMNCWILILLIWRDNKFDSGKLKSILKDKFLTSRLLPVLVANFCIWLPGVIVVYIMPTPLQIPVAATILCFWVLILTYIENRICQLQQASYNHNNK